jgi:two-component system CheB/CheR fusion protein
MTTEPADIPDPTLRILIVEDSRDAAYSLALLIRSYSSHVVDIAFSGEEALTHAVAFRPDVILLDIGLPKMDGFEVAQRLRKMPETAQVVIIAITGHCDPTDLEASAAAGINLHLAKPVELKQLMDHLHGLTKAR